MWSRVSLWVMRRQAAYRIDDRDGWMFHLIDAAGASFSWKGVDYSGGIPASAPAYLDAEVPPGTYVAWASRGSGGEAEETHRAILAVHDEPLVVVRLLPRPRSEPCPDGGHEPEPEGRCRIDIVGVQGDKIRDGLPGRIIVRGKAEHCPRVRVIVQANGVTLTETVDVEQDGTWAAALRNEGIKCVAVVEVTVVCEADRRCIARGEFRLDCERPKQKPKRPKDRG